MSGQIRDLRALHPAFKPRVEKWIQACNARGIQLLVVETARTWEVMEAYYARGRKPLAEVNALYRRAGLRAISAPENDEKITLARPGESWHYLRLAVDAVPLINGKPDWVYDPEDPKDYFDEMASEAEKLGFIWGGKFRSFPDRPHIEWHPGWATTRLKGVVAALAVTERLGHLDIPLKGFYGDKGFVFPV